MRISYLLLAAFLTVAFAACKKNNVKKEEKTGTLELVFKGQYNGSPMPTFTEISTNQANPTKLLFKKLEFFISEIKGKKNGELVDISDVQYVNLNNLSDNTKAEAGFKVTLNNVPVGTYDELMYGVGVPDAVNETAPGDYNSDSPLGTNGRYWSSWNSYIFCKIEGTATKADSTQGDFLYHAGVNGMYQVRSFNKEFTVNESATSTLTFHIHGQDLFFKTGQEIDVLTETTTHSGEVGSANYLLAKKAITNLADALHVH